MLKILRDKFVLLVSLLALCVVQRSFASESGSRWLVSPELLEHARLKTLWENELPIKKTDSLEQLLILGNRIYALSHRSYMISLNREKGNMIFVKSFTPAGLPIEGLNLYGDELISIAGSKLFEIDPESGKDRRTMNVGFGIVCPAVRNSSYFYLGGVDGRLHTLRANDKVQVFEAAAKNESMITSIVADETFVVFATDAGNVVGITPNRPRQLWPQFDAAGSIIGPIVRDGMSLFFASKDTNVYRVDMVGLSGRQLIWKYQAPGVLDRAPRVTQEVLYQYVPRKGLMAIDKETGKFMWSVPDGDELLAEVMGKAYVITRKGTFVVMDNVRAKKLYSVNFAQVSRYAANTVDSKIYIADKRGRMACLQPVE